MKSEHKELAIVLGIAAVIVFIALPKKKLKLKNFSKAESFDVPTMGKITDNEFKNAVDGITAIRLAMNNNVSKAELEELKRDVLKENNVRILEQNNLLIAASRNGTEIAREQK